MENLLNLEITGMLLSVLFVGELPWFGDLGWIVITGIFFIDFCFLIFIGEAALTTKSWFGDFEGHLDAYMNSSSVGSLDLCYS